METTEDKEDFTRIECDGRESWLEARKNLRQASDAAVILGCSPWKTPARLYDEIMGSVKVEDIGDKPYVIYGKNMEPLIRAQMMLDLPYFELFYSEFGILVSKARPWQGCTLDGELTVVTHDNPWGFRKGVKGVLECKTGSFRRESDLDEWKEGIPQHYYCQVIHQLSVTQYDFVIVVARVKRDGFKEEDQGFPEVRWFYRIVDRRNPQVIADINALNEEEASFNMRLEQKRRPPVTLSLDERKLKL